MTGADIELICKKAALMTIRNTIGKQSTGSGELVITENDFTHAVEEVKRGNIRVDAKSKLSLRGR